MNNASIGQRRAPAKEKPTIILVAFYDIDSFPVCTLHSVLKKTGWDVRSFFFKKLNPNNTMTFPSESEMDCFVSAIKAAQPLFVGMSVRSTHFELASELSRRIRQETGAVVLWGGVHATIRPDQSIQHADIVCVGEGEDAIVELAARLHQHAPIDDIKNLWINKNGTIIKNDLRPLIQDLDRLPFPDFTSADKYLFEDGKIKAYPSEKKTYWIMTSRGCPYSCSYCCNNVLRKVYKDKGPYVRRRSVDNVLAELTLAKSLFPGLSFLAFEDDVFAMNLEWLKAFTPEYKKQIGLPFFCYCYPSVVSAPLIELLKDAGATSMTMGIQSGSSFIRRECYGRRESNEDIINAARILNRFGIQCSYDIILDSKLESEADQQATFDLVSKLPRPFHLHTHTLTHFPETDLTKMLLSKKLIGEEEVEDRQQKSYERWTPKLDLKRSKQSLYWDNLYYLFEIDFISTERILQIAKVRFFKDHPHILTLVLLLSRKIAVMVYFAFRAVRFIFRRLKLLFKNEKEAAL
ncbi:MAG TPA: cobalamin-dependent protein [Candidatus Omnitrophota bacterium]|nr:cobalamin-dependent protein [Candidatus Omnitrophota bacterium]